MVIEFLVCMCEPLRLLKEVSPGKSQSFPMVSVIVNFIVVVQWHVRNPGEAECGWVM